MDLSQSTSLEGETPHAEPLVTVRYWAAARKAAGVAEEKHAGATVAEVLDAARDAHQGSDRFAGVLDVSSFLLGEEPLGTRDLAAVSVESGDVIEVLPPFAGG
jgi:molybdopterin converting factor small subunit